VVGLAGVPAVPLAAQGTQLQRGDVDRSGGLNISDAISTLNFLFSGGEAPPCTAIANSNGDANLNITDPVFLLGFLFSGTEAPPPLTHDENLTCKGLDPAAVARGMIIYQEPDPDLFASLFTCALCHVTSPETATDQIRSGHTLQNALGRPSFKQGQRDFLGATNICRVDWMQAKPWTAETPQYADLLQFLRSVETAATAPALAFQIIAPAKTGPSTGDAQAGCARFLRTCAMCHGETGAGTFLGNILTIPADPPDPQDPLDNPDYLRCRIRMSGPSDPTPYRYPEGCTDGQGNSISRGNNMPFFPAEKVTDTEVEDLVAFILLSRQTTRDTGSPLDCTDDDPGEGNVVRRGDLTGVSHGIGGTVEELDTGKIRLTNFDYDGNGILVKLWLFKAGASEAGRAIGPDLFRPAEPYAAATLVVDVPSGITPDQYDSVGIRCISSGQDFGSAPLAAVP
jgi:mono/diheme cytochrome c family protein